MSEKDLLLADLEHFGESLWRNEEVGEKRFNYFVTLVTAVSGALIALTNSPAAPTPEQMALLVDVSLLALLAVGGLTYLRMLQRNRVTDQFQNTLRYLRQRYLESCGASEPYPVPQPRTGRLRAVPRGGLAETVAAVDGALLAALLYRLLDGRLEAQGPVPLGVGLAAGGLLAVVLSLAAYRDRRGMAPPAEADGTGFRAGVGAVLTDGAGRLLAFERSDVAGAWQLPQGGLLPGEEPRAAVLREIAEETGIEAERLELLDELAEPLAYELPPELRSPKTGRGQVQYWFLFRLRDPGEPFRLPEGGEFRAWRWTGFPELVQGAVPFRRGVYRRLSQAFHPAFA